MEKKKKLCIILLAMIFMLFFIIYNLLPEEKDNKQATVKNITQTESSTFTPSPPEQEIDVKEYTNNEKIKTLKDDVKAFLNSYTLLTDGTYESEKEKYELLIPKMTGAAVEKYLNTDILQNPSSFDTKAQIVAKLINKDINVYYSMVSTSSNKARICATCKQIVQSTNIKNEYPYHLIGVFKYDKSSNIWRCDSIETASSYHEQ